MERNVNYAVVGAGVIVAIMMLIAVVTWISGTQRHRSLTHYTVYFNDAVTGLSAGGEVSYRGVNVGDVLAIHLAKGRPRLIKVDIEIDPSTPINQDTVAQLEPKGITGQSFIELRTSNISAPPAARLAGERYPVIHASPSQLDRVFNDLPKISAQLLVVTEQLGKLLADKNVHQVEALLVQTRGLVDGLRAVPGDLDKMTEQAGQTLHDMDGGVNATTAAVSDLRRAIPQLEGTLSDFDRLATHMDRLVTENEGGIRRFTNGGLNDLTDLIRRTNETLESVQELVNRIKADPSQLIYRSRYTGVEIPK